MTLFRRRSAQATALLCGLLVTACLTEAQAVPGTVAPLLQKEVQPKAVTAYQLQRYLMKDIPKPVVPRYR